MIATEKPAPGPPEHETRVLLRMALTPGMGIRSCHQMLGSVQDPGVLVRLQPRELESMGAAPEAAREFLSASMETRVEAEWERAVRFGAEILDFRHSRYPRLLLETADPPLVLYVKGRAWDPARPHLAVVGARRATPYGINCAERLAADLASRGVVVASGLARGIDAAAHRGALGAGRTIAVLGTGIDRIYPKENAGLAESIIENGAIFSEFPLGTPPLPDHFPRRNRILAGMTLGTVVVEAAARSGSLITARMALEADREVFAVPGPIQSDRSRGPHLLIRQGACLVASGDDVVEELPETVRRALGAPDGAAHDSAPAASLSAMAERTRRLISASEATPIDFLIAKLDLPVSEVSAALLELELAGMIRSLPGDRWVLKM